VIAMLESPQGDFASGTWLSYVSGAAAFWPADAPLQKGLPITFPPLGPENDKLGVARSAHAFRSERAVPVVLAIVETAHGVFFGTDQGIFEWTKDSGNVLAGKTVIRAEIPDAGDIFRLRIEHFFPAGAHVLYQEGDEVNMVGELSMFTGVPPGFGTLQAAGEYSGKLLLGTNNGLYIAEETGSWTTPVKADWKIGSVTAIFPTHDGVLIGTDSGLIDFQLAGDWGVRAKLKRPISAFVRSDERFLINWQIDEPNCRDDIDNLQQFISVVDEHGRSVLPATLSVPKGRFDQVIPPLGRGKRSIVLHVRNIWGDTATATLASFDAGETFADRLKRYASNAGMVYAILNALTFVVLIIGARHSQKCFAILTDPTISRLGVYFTAAIKYSTTIRLFVFQLYFRTLSSRARSDHEYLPVALLRDGRSPLDINALMSDFMNAEASRIWIQGPPGSGKTELLRQIMSRYLSFRSIEGAYRSFKCIAIFIPLREYRATSIVDLVRKSLSSSGLDFEGAYLEKLMPHSRFFLLIDGANEAQLDKELSDFLATHPSVGCIVTSQSPAPRSFGDIAFLPEISKDFARSLFLSMRNSAPSALAVSDSGRIWAEIKSGFDVRLLASLNERSLPLPESRQELFSISLEAAYNKFSMNEAPIGVFRLAWNLWIAGRRAFSVGPEISEAEIQPLIEDRLVVPRGELFEFGHDLLRGYLSAAWIVKFTASTKAMIGRLEEKRIWDLAPTEQDLVFPFTVSMIQSRTDLQAVFSFSTAEADLRTRLVVACITRAREIGLDLQLLS
jgi:hypothetical protein